MGLMIVRQIMLAALFYRQAPAFRGKSHGLFEVQANKWQSRTLKPDLSDLKLDHFPLLLLPPFSPLPFVRSWGTVENR